MPTPTTAIIFNSTTPPAPEGRENIIFQTDGLTPAQHTSAHVAAIPGIASRAEAEAGTDNTTMMTPLRTAEAIDALAAVGGAPADAHYLTTQAESGLSAESSLGALADNSIVAVDVAASVASPRAAIAADVVGLFSGSGGYLKSDGTRGTPSSGGSGSGEFYVDSCSPLGLYSPVLVQSASAAATLAVTLAGVTSGNLLVVAFHWEGALGTTAVSDNHGGTWVKAADQAAGSNSSMWYSIAGSSASYTITATAGGTGYSGIVVSEFHHAQAVVDVSAKATGYSTSATTTVAEDLLVSNCSAYHNGCTFSAPALWHLIIQQNASDAIGLGYCLARATGLYSPSWTVNGGTDNTSIILAAFKAATGGTDYSGVGSDGALFMNLATGDLYKRITGAWAYQSTLALSVR